LQREREREERYGEREPEPLGLSPPNLSTQTIIAEGEIERREIWIERA
jgi:hypothetical protein